MGTGRSVHPTIIDQRSLTGPFGKPGDRARAATDGLAMGAAPTLAGACRQTTPQRRRRHRHTRPGSRCSRRRQAAAQQQRQSRPPLPRWPSLAASGDRSARPGSGTAALSTSGGKVCGGKGDLHRSRRQTQPAPPSHRRGTLHPDQTAAAEPRRRRRGRLCSSRPTKLRSATLSPRRTAGAAAQALLRRPWRWASSPSAAPSASTSGCT